MTIQLDPHIDLNESLSARLFIFIFPVYPKLLTSEWFADTLVRIIMS